MFMKTKKSGLSLVELIITIVIATLILAYVWKIYFSGRETMRNTVSQSQMQSETRIFLDHLDNQMASCYSFFEVNPTENKLGFYSFVYSRTPLDTIIYDTTGKVQKTGATSKQKIKVVRYEYVWLDGQVTLNRAPGWLYFLQKPMKFEDGNPDHYLGMYKKITKVVLRDIAHFEFKGYQQAYFKPPKPKKPYTEIKELKPEEASSTVFITLRIHTKKDEGKKRRDEELDILTKFYSKVKLNAAMNKGYFCSTDQNGKF